MLQPGETILIEDSGGGGYGDPRKRAREKVLADVDAGFVTEQAARERYGLAG